MVLFSAPLMENENTPHYSVSFEGEINELKTRLSNEKRPITFNLDILTTNFLGNLYLLRPQVLHYIGHGGLNSIAMENEKAML